MPHTRRRREETCINVVGRGDRTRPSCLRICQPLRSKTKNATECGKPKGPYPAPNAPPQAPPTSASTLPDSPLPRRHFQTPPAAPGGPRARKRQARGWRRSSCIGLDIGFASVVAGGLNDSLHRGKREGDEVLVTVLTY